VRIAWSHIEKLEVLIATGMPGAYKVFIFFLLQQVHGLALLGQIATWQSIAQIFGFFTAIGWCSLIMVRVAKQEIEPDKVAAFNNLFLMSMATLAVVCALVMLTGISLSKILDAWQITLWICAWTFYQLPRHYLIALKRYRQALVMDSAIIASSTGFLFLTTEPNVSAMLVASMLICGCITILHIQKNNTDYNPSTSYDIKGLEYGLANLLTGGISLSIVPFAAHFEGKELAGAISLFMSISGVALLLPRALSLRQLPEISKKINNQNDTYKFFIKNKRQITICNTATTALSLITAAVTTYQFSDEINKSTILPILFLLTLQSTAGTQTLPYANILMAQERSKPALIINSQSFLLYLAACSLLLTIQTTSPTFYLCSIILVLSALRLFQIRSKISFR